MSYGERLKRIRKGLGLTQHELAKTIGLRHKQTISDIENGKQQRLSAKHELAFCQKYGINTLWLQTGKGSEYNSEVLCGHIQEPEICYGNRIGLTYYPSQFMGDKKGKLLSLHEKKMMYFEKDFLEYYLGLSSYQNIFIVDYTGESVASLPSTDSLLFVNPFENEGEIKDGSIYLLLCEDVSILRRVYYNPIDKKYTFVSDKNREDVIVVTDLKKSRCEIIGRVVGLFSKGCF